MRASTADLPLLVVHGAHLWMRSLDAAPWLHRIRGLSVSEIRTASSPWRTPFQYEGASVGDLAVHAVARRDALKLAGLPAEAARWDVIYRRCDAVLRDRRRLVALMLWAE